MIYRIIVLSFCLQVCSGKAYGPTDAIPVVLASAASASKTDESGDAIFFSTLEQDNDVAFATLQDMISCKDGWSCVAEKQGVRVDRRFVPAGPYVSKADAAKGSKHACVMSSAVIDASPDAVFDLFTDNDRVKEYNEHCSLVKDVKIMPRLHLDKWTKLAWAASPSYGPFKPRDFLSVVHYRKFGNGTSVILNRPAYLTEYEPSEKFVRATVLLAANIIRPHGANQTHLTLLAQVNPGGGADTPAAAWIINKLCAAGPPAFIRKLEVAAQKKKKNTRFTIPATMRFPGSNINLLPSSLTASIRSSNQLLSRCSGQVNAALERLRSECGVENLMTSAVTRLVHRPAIALHSTAHQVAQLAGRRYLTAMEASRKSVQQMLHAEVVMDPSIRTVDFRTVQQPLRQLFSVTTRSSSSSCNGRSMDSCTSSDAAAVNYRSATCGQAM